jgi:hypothetical protein
MSIYNRKIHTYTIYSPWSRSKLILPYKIAYASFQSQNTYRHDLQYMIKFKETILDFTLQITYTSICFISIKCLFFCGNQMLMVLFKIPSMVQQMSTNIEAYTNLFLYAEKTRWNGNFSKGFCSPWPLYVYTYIYMYRLVSIGEDARYILLDSRNHRSARVKEVDLAFSTLRLRILNRQSEWYLSSSLLLIFTSMGWSAFSWRVFLLPSWTAPLYNDHMYTIRHSHLDELITYTIGIHI